MAAMVATQLKEIPMAKAKSKRKLTSRVNSKKSKAPNSIGRTTARKVVPLQPTARRQSKKAYIIAMLRAPAGATIEAMARAAEWQPHSVRGFLAGVVRKKLGLTLVSADDENGRVYRITDRTTPVAA